MSKLKRLSLEITRPSNAIAYTAGDAINNLCEPVKKKVTITLSGTSGTANVTLAGGLTKLATFSSSLSTTASNFVTAHAAAYLQQGIVVTSSGANLIFEAGLAGYEYTTPAITNASGNLAGTVYGTKKRVNIELTGSGGTANVGLAGGLTKLATYNTSLTQTATDFVASHAAAYAAVGITVTSSGANLIFESTTAGFEYITPTITNVTSDLSGTITVICQTNINTTPVKKLVAITVSGQRGTAMISGAGGLSRKLQFNRSLTQTMQDFRSDYAADYLAKGININNTESVGEGDEETIGLTFEAVTAGVDFVTPVFTPTNHNLSGTVVVTTANLTTSIKKKKVTVTLAGTSGTAEITGILNQTYLVTFATSLTVTASNFIVTNGPNMLEEGISVTSNVGSLIFESLYAGESFVTPVITNKTGNLIGNVTVNVDNAVSPAGLLLYAVENSGEAGIVTDIIVESNDVTNNAGKVITVWLYKEPPVPVADNAPLLNYYENKDNFLMSVDVTLGSSISGSDSVIGVAAPAKYFKCSDTSANLYAVLQHKTGGNAEAGKKMNLTLNVLRID